MSDLCPILPVGGGLKAHTSCNENDLATQTGDVGCGVELDHGAPMGKARTVDRVSNKKQGENNAEEECRRRMSGVQALRSLLDDVAR